MLTCVPALRRQRVGYFLAVHGTEVMKAAVAERGGRIAGLSFNPSMLPLYNSLGFYESEVGSVYRVRLLGSCAAAAGGRVSAVSGVVDIPHVGFARALSDAALWTLVDSSHEAPRSGGVRSLVDAAVAAEWSAVVDYDASVFPARREAFVHMWLANAHAGVQWRDACGTCGYACVRKSDVGFRVGPLFADSADVATELLRALLARVPTGQPVFVDVPHRNSAAVLRLGGEVVAENLHVLLGPTPAPSYAKVFGVTTTEAG
jgi:hypothetical protein